MADPGRKPLGDDTDRGAERVPKRAYRARRPRDAGGGGVVPGIPIVEDQVAVRARRPRTRSVVTEVFDDARFHEIATLIVFKRAKTAAELAARTGLSLAQLKRITTVHAAKLNEIAGKIRTQFVERVASIAADEREDVLLRDEALSIRARTIAAKLLAEVESRIDRGTARSADLRVALGAATAFGGRDAVGGRTADRSINLTVAAFAPTVGQAAVIADAFVEAETLSETVGRWGRDADADRRGRGPRVPGGEA